MTAFDNAWDLLKDQSPEFNPGDSEDGWRGNIPRNAEEAYEAAKRGEAVYHCPSCDAYLDSPVCYGHAIQYDDDGDYRSGFKQPANARMNPIHHAFRRPSGAIGGAEQAIPAWEMSARERYGIGYNPVPDPSEAVLDDPDDKLLDMVQGTFGALSEYQNIDDPNKPSFREFMQQRNMDAARQQRLSYLLWLADKTGLSSDELAGMLRQPEYSEVGIDEQGYSSGILDDLSRFMRD